jgi:hypothetical protein
MAGEADRREGAGNGGDSGNGPGEGGGQRGQQPPPQGGAGAAGGGQSQGFAGLGLDDLPEPLRRFKNKEELKTALHTVVTSYGSLREENERLRAEQRSAPAAAAPPPEPDPDDEKDLSELIMENPEKGIEKFLQKRGLLQKFNELESNVGETTISIVGREFDDWGEYEDDVRQILKQSGAPATKENIVGAYSLAVGQRTIQEKKRGRQAIDNMEASEDDGGDKEPERPKLTALEDEIRKGLGLSVEDFTDTYANADNFEIKVPTGRK